MENERADRKMIPSADVQKPQLIEIPCDHGESYAGPGYPIFLLHK
jgi:hypothetical protein